MSIPLLFLDFLCSTTKRVFFSTRIFLSIFSLSLPFFHLNMICLHIVIDDSLGGIGASWNCYLVFIFNVGVILAVIISNNFCYLIYFLAFQLNICLSHIFNGPAVCGYFILFFNVFFFVFHVRHFCLCIFKFPDSFFGHKESTNAAMKALLIFVVVCSISRIFLLILRVSSFLAVLHILCCYIHFRTAFNKFLYLFWNVCLIIPFYIISKSAYDLLSLPREFFSPVGILYKFFWHHNKNQGWESLEWGSLSVWLGIGLCLIFARTVIIRSFQFL